MGYFLYYILQSNLYNYERGKIVSHVQPLENLIISFIVQDYTEVITKNICGIQVALDERKISFLNKYINRYELQEHVSIDIRNGNVIIKESVPLARILKEWTNNGVVIAMEPNKLSSNFFMLWLCLFGQKKEKSVLINSNLPVNVKTTLQHFFYTLLNARLIDKGDHLQVMPFTNILLFSYQRKGTIEETSELNYLLPDRDRKKIKSILLHWEEEHEKVY